ncbi:CoA ester lyase [uncultured Shimia sp.]|uniref:HpcH/HpaI aldolase/citrate lyase family protein n=1 Tax=uncultured Shimia sp. TaxID=573152 RepID=UPI0025FAB0EF|nr:CoA ester lyase [uncultured Shimia sp.]
MTDLNSARSLLFVPGDRPERFVKAAASGAHAIIIDLEDAVSPEDKANARFNIIKFLNDGAGGNVLVRINDGASAFYEGDLDVAQHPNLSGVILPKANTRHVTELLHKMECPVWPLVETIQGVSEVREFAVLHNVQRLLLGTIDLSNEMGLDVAHPGGKSMLDQARFKLVSASGMAAISPPIDGVFPSLDDEPGLIAAAENARASGMGGMMCIHPRQIGAVHTAFAPSAMDIEWAQAVIEASSNEKSSFRFRGQMIDKPVLDRAKGILNAEVLG